MTDNKKLVADLLWAAEDFNHDGDCWPGPELHQAAQVVQALEERVKVLAAALKPFCHMETNLDLACADGDMLECYAGVTAGDVRLARAALGET